MHTWSFAAGAMRFAAVLGVAMSAHFARANLIQNGGFETWQGGQTIDHGHDVGGGDGTYDGDSTSDWQARWDDLRDYSSIGEDVQWVRMDEFNRESGTSAAPIVGPTSTEGSGSFVNNNYLPSEGMASWSVFGDIDVKSSYWNPQDSTSYDPSNTEDRISLDLSCTRGGGVQQSFDTIAGRTYTVTFDMSANMYGGVNPRDLLVQVGTGQKSVYEDLGGDASINGSFVPIALGDYSSITSDGNALTAAGGSAGTRVSYTTIDLASGAVNSASVTDGWGTSRTIGDNIQVRDDDDGGLTGLHFWFDVNGNAGSGIGSAITSSDPDWTTVTFDFTAPATQTMTLLFSSLEGGTSGNNWGPAIDDISVVPEPSTLGLAAALLIFGCASRRPRQAAGMNA